ncbi:hypothetical protein B0O99DRAFT_148580 [Bisporella sp. PMI_857]|nr:hypothetical protein B0O99DRAFT_148580 [Bisporella sp. PMI_857]
MGAFLCLCFYCPGLSCTKHSIEMGPALWDYDINVFSHLHDQSIRSVYIFYYVHLPKCSMLLTSQYSLNVSVAK